jgi:hypothetical protein
LGVGAAKCLQHLSFLNFLPYLPATWGDEIFYYQTMLYSTANQQEFCMIIDQYMLEAFPPHLLPSKTMKKCAKTLHTKHKKHGIIANDWSSC